MAGEYCYQPYFPLRACIGSNPCPSLTRDHLTILWNLMESEDKVRWLFYDGKVRDVQDYIDFMTDPAVHAYALYERDWETPLATYFVNNFIGKAAMLHFCYFDAGLSRREALAIDTCNFLLKGHNGGISALIGITPLPFRHAWKFALSVGFERKAILPKACHVPYIQRGAVPLYTDAIVTLCTPESLLAFPYKFQEYYHNLTLNHTHKHL